MAKFLIGSLIATLLATAGAVGAADDFTIESASQCKVRLRDEVECFTSQAQYAHLMCSLKWELSILNGDMTEGLACSKIVEKPIDAHFRAARARLAKNASAMTALKDAYAYWIATIRGQIPASGETKGDYQRRQTERKQGLNERMARIKIER